MDERIEKLVLDSTKQGNESRRQISMLIDVLKNIPKFGGELRAVVQPPRQDPVEVRAEKLQRLTLALRKSNKIKDFKDVLETDIKTWLKKFDFEIVALKRMVGIADYLTKEEYIPLIRDKLDYTIVKRLDALFCTKESSPAMGSNISGRFV